MPHPKNLMNNIADQLPPEVAFQLHPDRRKNEAAYWAVRDQLLDQYRGRWIGFADGKLVASGKRPVAVFHVAEATGLHPFFICVGREEQPCRIRRVAFPCDADYTSEALPSIRRVPGRIRNARFTAAVVVVMVAISTALPSAEPPPDKPAGQAWSDAVNGLRARLVLKRTEVIDGTPIISTYLELRNVSDVGNPMALQGSHAKQEFKVIDAEGRAMPPPATVLFDGKIGGIQGDLVIPFHSTLSFDISGRGAGIPADKAGMIDMLGGPWEFDDAAKAYRLKATIEIPEAKRADNDPNWQWHGRIEIPAVAVPLKPEPLDPAKVGSTIEQLGKVMLGNDFAAREEAVRALSLIDDPRVIPWYLKAMDTDSDDLKFAALDRLARLLPGDAALAGLKKGIKTQGLDIGNSTTSAVAAQAVDGVRLEAAHALARSPNPDAKRLLLSMWNDPYPGVRNTVVHALGKMDSAESLTMLRKMSQDPDASVRNEAKRYLRLRE